MPPSTDVRRSAATFTATQDERALLASFKVIPIFPHCADLLVDDISCRVPRMCNLRLANLSLPAIRCCKPDIWKPWAVNIKPSSASFQPVLSAIEVDDNCLKVVQSQFSLIGLSHCWAQCCH